MPTADSHKDWASHAEPELRRIIGQLRTDIATLTTQAESHAKEFDRILRETKKAYKKELAERDELIDSLRKQLDDATNPVRNMSARRSGL